jgi:hypothetical protein
LAVEDGPFDGLVGVFGFPGFELFLEICGVFFATSGVGDDVEFVGEPGYDCVVYNAASFWVEEGGKGGLLDWQGRKRGRGYAFEKGLSACPRKVMLHPVDD